jgi:light-regulated signal transduction histidine kinase (bacteriophytochrome)
VQVRPIWDQRDEEGKRAASFAVVVVHDITERKRAEEELRKHRDHLEELVKERTAELTRANEQLQREITDRKRAEEMLVQQAEELARSNAELEQFAYVASHDLQEPLRMVTSHLQLLEQRYKGKLNANANEFIAYAIDGATRMQMTIEDLLAYSRVGMWGEDFEPTDCEAVLAHTLADLQVAIEESGAVVTHDPLPMVMADDLQLGQVFQNLIGNAIKFRGEEPPRVHVSAQQEGDEWVFSVRDNGIGIDPEYADCIFEIFQRLHTWEEYPGAGIGLATCKKIMERHGGRIWVESQPREGSTFYFTIPA